MGDEHGSTRIKAVLIGEGGAWGIALLASHMHLKAINEPLEAQTEPGTGIRKRIEIHLSPDKPSVTLTHTLINDGLWTVELAPWAITQFRLGERVILPLPVGNVDAAGLLHNRQLSLLDDRRPRPLRT